MNHFYLDDKNFQFEENWFTFATLYKMFVEICPLEGHIVEVGTWKGRSISFLAVEAINSEKNIKLTCVDTWLGSKEHTTFGSSYYNPNADSLYNVFLKNIEPVKHVVTPIRLPSVEASNLFENNSLDIVFLDASHEYEDVLNDINSWYPKVKPGGILAGHDYDFGWPGVNKAVNEKFNSDFENLTNDKCWVHYKK